jgi:hypothetical protein
MDIKKFWWKLALRGGILTLLALFIWPCAMKIKNGFC